MRAILNKVQKQQLQNDNLKNLEVFKADVRLPKASALNYCTASNCFHICAMSRAQVFCPLKTFRVNTNYVLLSEIVNNNKINASLIDAHLFFHKF